MNRRTLVFIGATVAVLGIGFYALGLVAEEATVRYVSDLVADPDAHQEGTFTLVGVPHTPQIPVYGSDGQTLIDDPDYRNTTQHTVAWHDGGLMHATLSLHVEGPDANGTSHWTLRNETRRAGHAEILHSQETSWSITVPHRVFLIEGFTDEAGQTSWIWGVYEGVMRDPIQPKPSQFEGRLAGELGGVALPQGALVYDVDVYTAGCSSKFLPPDYEEEEHVAGNETYTA